MRVVITNQEAKDSCAQTIKLTARFGNQVTTESELAFEIKQVHVSVLVLLDLL